MRDYNVLDSPTDEAFDDVVLLAAQICNTSIALVSLLDLDRQWFKARTGLEATETPIDQSVCKNDIDQPGLLIIPDLTVDPRTRENPLVTGELGIRFYAGAPLITPDGIAIGRLCVIDKVARPQGLSPEQQDALAALARQVIGQLELRQSVRAASEVARLQQTLLTVGEQIRNSPSVAEMTHTVAETVGVALDLSRAGYGVVDATTETVDIRPDWTADGMSSIAGTHRFADFGRIRDEIASGEPLIIDDVHTDPRTSENSSPMKALEIGALVNMPVRNHGRTEAVFIAQSRTARKWTDAELDFFRNVADRLESGVTRNIAEAQQQALNEEIGHRFKNMLAMVQAIAGQTLSRVDDRESVENFQRRLLALSSAHDVLMQGNWSSTELNGVLDAVLDTFGYGGRVETGGPAVMLGSRASLSLSLLVHELMTNAIKYGALSTDAGQVAVKWTVNAVNGEPTLCLQWREKGGPPVAQPERKGFGSKLIQLGLVGTGGVEVRYEPSGVEADTFAKIDHLTQL